MMQIHKSFRYRIYPTAEQARRLDAWAGALRFLWNLAHEQRLLGIARPKGERRYYTGYDQIGELTHLRKELPWLAEVPRNVCAQLLHELDKAWQRCFKKLARQPRWKRKGCDVVSLCEPHPKVWRIENGSIMFPKIRAIRAVIHRPLEGTPKTCAIVRDGDQWFAAISCVVDISDPVAPKGAPIALDRGVITLVADSDGGRITNPRLFARQQKRLARAQRVVARRKKGSKNQQKARARVMRIHRKTRRQRDHHLHHIANRYAKSHSKVIVERLQVPNMTRSARGTKENPGTNVRAKSGLNRSILDAGWGKLLVMLTYKCAWSGSALVQVRAAYS